MQPYGDAAWAYREAGWLGVLPLPPGAKWPPPGGFTGWAGVDPSGADVQAWCDGMEGYGNIALRLPSGVYGLDVDDYGGKTGGAALGALVEQLGPLPPTWIVSSREASTSGIRLFRADLPPGRRWRNEPAGHGAGIESIHLGHRYAVVAPSMHPETGRKYQWRRPDGIVAGDDELPRPGDLPHLPAAWIEALSEAGETRTGELAGHAETVERVTSWREGEPCQRVTQAHQRAMGGLSAAAAGAALHPAIVTATHELASLGHEGHAGVRRALAEHYVAAVEVRAGREGDRASAEAEWWRAVRGAVGKLRQADHREVCDCELWSGAGLLFDPGPYGPGTGQLSRVVDQTGGENSSSREPNALTADATGQDLPVEVELDWADRLIEHMLSPAQLRDRPAPPWLIEGLLTVDSASWLIAAPSSYKSFVALDWAGHVGAGRPWLGRTTTAGPVVYMVAEGVGGMGPRIRAWEQRNGPMVPAVRFLPMPVQIGKPDHWAALVEACRRIAPVLVILDTQARITVGLDENDNTAMGGVVDAIESLRKATGACVLVVHHTGRNGTHARGASALDGAQDTELRLTRTADYRVTLQVDKSKNSRDDERVDLELFVTQLDNGGDSLVVGAPLTTVAVPDWSGNLPMNQATLVEVMADIFPAVGATKAELKAEVRKRVRRGLDGAVVEPMGDSSFRRAWDELVDAGRLQRVEGHQRYVISELNSVDMGVSE